MFEIKAILLRYVLGYMWREYKISAQDCDLIFSVPQNRTLLRQQNRVHKFSRELNFAINFCHDAMGDGRYLEKNQISKQDQEECYLILCGLLAPLG